MVRWRSSSVYSELSQGGYQGIYDASGVYRYPYEPLRETWWKRPLPSLFWPVEVFEQVRDALADLLLAELRAVTT
jgi:hypothetical protein